MVEENPSSDVATAPIPPAATPEPPPLRAVFLVWPGRMHAQTWMFLWLGVAYLLGSLLPWDGPFDRRYVMTDGSIVDAATYHLRIEQRAIFGVSAEVGEVAEVVEPGMGFGQVILLLCAIGMVMSGVINIWNRKLTVWPSLLTWLAALCVLYFSNGVEINPRKEAVMSHGGFQHIGHTFEAIFGNFGSLFQRVLPADVERVLDRFGIGYYVTMVAEIFLIVFIVGSIVSGMIGSKKGAPAAKPASGARRPGRR